MADNNEVRKQDANDAWSGLKFTVTDPVHVSMQATGDAPAVTLEYSVDSGSTWLPFIPGDTVVALYREGGSADTMYLRAGSGGNYAFSLDNDTDYWSFSFDGFVSASGSIMSLLAQDFGGLDSIPGPYCFARLFMGCDSLLSAPDLPATRLSLACYRGMFYGCSRLTAAPELNATTLSVACYSDMFFGCTGLQVAPALPAEELAPGCYDYMFSGCTSITSITAAFFDAAESIQGWLHGVASSGVIHVPLGCVIHRESDNGIPVGWSFETRGGSIPQDGGLRFTGVADGSYVALDYGFQYGARIIYSFDGTNWLTLIPNDPGFVLKDGGTLYMAAADSLHGIHTGGNANFSIKSGAIVASGSINSLISPAHSGVTALPEYVFSGLFAGCSSLVLPPDLPATTLAQECYKEMFRGCTALEAAPVLPATTLAEFCYAGMFTGCSSLTEAPTLEADTLYTCCYQSMFSECTSLQRAPDLPATVLAPECYEGMFADCTGLVYAGTMEASSLDFSCCAHMFRGCSSLESAPALFAQVLTESCYFHMFDGCTSLRHLVVGFKAWADELQATESWVSGVPDTGEFHCRKGLPHIYDASHIPGPAPESH